MENLDDEMDDLFRQAGEQYPLKTSDSDWDSVLARLQPDSGEDTPFLISGGKKGNSRRRLFWLLLLLPLALLSIKYFENSGAGDRKTTPATAVSRQSAITGKPAGAMAKTAYPGSAPDEKSVSPATRNGSATYSGEDAAGSRESDQQKTENHTAGAKKTHEAGEVHVKGVHEANSHTRSESYENVQRQAHENTGTKATAYAKQRPGSNRTSEQRPRENQGGISSQGSTTVIEPQDQAGVENAGGKEATTAVSPRTDSAITKTAQSETPKQEAARKAPQQKKSRVSAEKEIYLSLVAGPDLSTVKFQAVKNTGYSIGLIAGYRFSKHLAVEAGIFWDKKQYYTDGKYFNKSKTNIPASYDIRDLDGNCNMFEIPIALRYDFSITQRGRFFSTAGISSYLMKKENYSYSAYYSGSAWSHDVSYKNSGNNFFSILQLSAGYEYNLGKIGRLRIEPYFKIPLTGVGIGQLAISSAGLHLGITHSFR